MANLATVRQLQDRITGMQSGVPRVPVATPDALAGLVQLRTGGAYEVDGATLAMTLLAAPSREGSWAAVIGFDDFGAEAAAGLGVDLTRTLLVPDPGEQWLEATAALVDVVTMVVLRPSSRVTERTAGRVLARLRKRSAVLVVDGAWPGSEARLVLESSTWSGVGRGHGRLDERRAVVAVARGSAPVRRALVEFGRDGGVRRVEETRVEEIRAVVGEVG